MRTVVKFFVRSPDRSGLVRSDRGLRAAEAVGRRDSGRLDPVRPALVVGLVVAALVLLLALPVFATASSDYVFGRTSGPYSGTYVDNR